MTMKVLQINVTYKYGSTGRIVADIDTILKRSGHSSYVTYGRNYVSNDSNIMQIGSKFGQAVHGMLSRMFDMHGFGSYIDTLSIIKKIKRINPDIIHMHNLHGYYLHIGLLFQYLKSFQGQIIWTLHDPWAFTGHCAYFEQVGCMKWTNGCNKCPQKKEYPKSLVIDRSKQNYQKKKELFTSVTNITFTTASMYLANNLSLSYLKNYPCVVISNGVDTSIFKPMDVDYFKTIHEQGEKVILGVASIWEKRKGIVILGKLSKALKGIARVVIVGSTKNVTNYVTEDLILVPRTSNMEELASIYSSSDLFVNPTYEDTFPMTNLEALATGTPVITFNTGGSVECIVDGVGEVVDKHDFLHLVTVVKSYLAKEKSVYKDKCVTHAKALYDKQKIILRYLNLYNSVNNGESL